MFFTEHRDPPLLCTFDLPLAKHAVFQNGGFQQPSIEVLGQETVVMLERYFDSMVPWSLMSVPRVVSSRSSVLET